MDRLSLSAEDRKILGKKVKQLRHDGKLPAHVFGKGIDTEPVTVSTKDFLKTFHMAGETGLIDLKIGAEKVRPVLIRDVQYDPVSGAPIHIDFFQVDLTHKVKVPIPLVLTGEQPEAVHLGEVIVLQTINEVEVEALPSDLVEKIEVDVSLLKAIDDAITIGQLQFDRSKLTILSEDDEIVVKLAPAVTAEMEKLMEEQAAETAAAAQEEGAEEAAPAEGEVPIGGEAAEGTAVAKEESARAEDAAKETKAEPVKAPKNS